MVRLYEQVLGKEGFRKGMDLYFQRHDGQVKRVGAMRAVGLAVLQVPHILPAVGAAAAAAAATAALVLTRWECSNDDYGTSVCPLPASPRL